MSTSNVFFYLFKFISYQRMVCHDPNCGNIYINCSNVCEVASGLLTREAGTIGHKFSFKKTDLILWPVFALISQALQNTEYIAILMYIALFFIDIYIRIHSLRIDDSGFRKRAFNNSLMTSQLILSTRGSKKMINAMGTPTCTLKQLWDTVS
jgi:hypothetical protein